jgi:type II secretory pathway component PulC
MRIAFLSILFFVVIAAGCGAGKKNTEEQTASDTTNSGTDEKSQSEAAAAERAPAAGQISRSDMNRVLAAGPAALLAQVVTDPVRENGRFVGFRIAQFKNGEPTSIDLKTGDVILLVNGRKIERPENYFQIFEELRVASELRFKILRGGEELELSYSIVD